MYLPKTAAEIHILMTAARWNSIILNLGQTHAAFLLKDIFMSTICSNQLILTIFSGAHSTRILMFFTTAVCTGHVICVGALLQSLCVMNEVRDLHFVLVKVSVKIVS